MLLTQVVFVSCFGYLQGTKHHPGVAGTLANQAVPAGPGLERSDKILARQAPVAWALVTPLLARTDCGKAVAAAAPLSADGQNLSRWCQTIRFLLLLWFPMPRASPLLFGSCSLPCVPEGWWLSVQAVGLYSSGTEAAARGHWRGEDSPALPGRVMGPFREHHVHTGF